MHIHISMCIYIYIGIHILPGLVRRDISLNPLCTAYMSYNQCLGQDRRIVLRMDIGFSVCILYIRIYTHVRSIRIFYICHNVKCICIYRCLCMIVCVFGCILTVFIKCICVHVYIYMHTYIDVTSYHAVLLYIQSGSMLPYKSPCMRSSPPGFAGRTDSRSYVSSMRTILIRI